MLYFFPWLQTWPMKYHTVYLSHFPRENLVCVSTSARCRSIHTASASSVLNLIPPSQPSSPKSCRVIYFSRFRGQHSSRVMLLVCVFSLPRNPKSEHLRKGDRANFGNLFSFCHIEKARVWCAKAELGRVVLSSQIHSPDSFLCFILGEG